MERFWTDHIQTDKSWNLISALEELKQAAGDFMLGGEVLQDLVTVKVLLQMLLETRWILYYCIRVYYC